MAVRPNLVQIWGEISLRQGQIQFKHSQIHHSASVLQAVMLCSCFLWLLALITAIVEWTCDKQMSVWLLVYSLLPLLVLLFVRYVQTRTSPLSNEGDKDVVLGLRLLLPIVAAVFLIYISWIIYGIVLFFPAASSHPCRALSIVSSTCKLASQTLLLTIFISLLL